MLHVTAGEPAPCYDGGHVRWFRHSTATRRSNAIALALRRILSPFIAAYNAGLGPAKRWIRQFGDHRDTDVDVIKKVKSLAYRATHNYVQSGKENLQISRKTCRFIASGLARPRLPGEKSGI